MHTQRVLPSPVHRQRFGGLAGQVGVVAVPVRLETDVLPRRICTPSSASVDGHSQLGHEEHAVDGSAPDRSEEHTSELQSLMRISYAVFCLKKKKENK